MNQLDYTIEDCLKNGLGPLVSVLESHLSSLGFHEKVDGVIDSGLFYFCGTNLECDFQVVARGGVCFPVKAVVRLLEPLGLPFSDIVENAEMLKLALLEQGVFMSWAGVIEGMEIYLSGSPLREAIFQDKTFFADLSEFVSKADSIPRIEFKKEAPITLSRVLTEEIVWISQIGFVWNSIFDDPASLGFTKTKVENLLKDLGVSISLE